MWDTSGDDYDPTGTNTVFAITTGTVYRGKDYVLLEFYNSSINLRYIAGLWWIASGDTTVFSGPSGVTLTADFSATPIIGVTPLTVNFTDNSIAGSSGPITGWHYDFGDGNTSSSQNPSHTYTSAGSYTVSLTVTGTSPDGTNTETRTAYINVYIPATNVSCSTAINLDPNGGTMTINNTFNPDTPATDDPFNLPYPQGPELTDGSTPHQFNRNMWYKLTNTSSEKLFARFVFNTWTGIAAASLYFGCPPSAWAADTNYQDHLVPNFQLSDTFIPPDGFVGNGSFRNTLAGLTSFTSNPSSGYTLGVILQPGQTVYLEIAGDDASTFAGGAGHGWNGTMSLTWDLHATTFYDTIDNRVQPGDPTAIPGVDGLSETVPPHTPLDTSGFDTTDVGFGPGEVRFPIAYGYNDGKHFIAAVGKKDTADNWNGDAGASAGQDQVGVWVFDNDGTQLNFEIIFTGQHTTSLSFANSPAGEGVDLNSGAKFHFITDGTTVWLICPLYELVSNPYDSSTFPPHTWAPTHAAVFVWTGSGWSRIGAVEATEMDNASFDTFFGGGNTTRMFRIEACAISGTLHVITSSWGVQDGPDGVQSGLAPNYGTSPRQIRWSTNYGTFSSSTKLSQTPLDTFNAAAGSAADASIGSHFCAPEYCWLRGDAGYPVFVKLKSIDNYADHPTPTNTIQVFDLSSGSLVLLQTIVTTDLSAMYSNPHFWVSSWGTPDQFNTGTLSDNSQIDVGHDNEQVWFFDVNLRASSQPSNQGNLGTLLRIPVNNPSTWDYFESDATIANFSLGFQASFSFYCDPKQTWLLPGGTFNAITQYVRCVNSYIGIPSWQGNRTSYGSTFFNLSGAEWYPSLSFQFTGISLLGDYFYYAPIYTDDGLPEGTQQFFFAGALAKSHILRNWLICSIDETIAVLPNIFLVRISPNGEVRVITGNLKHIKVNTDGTVNHINASNSNFALVRISPNGDIKRL